MEALRKAGVMAADRATGISRISAINTTLDAFRRALEEGLNRPIVDETNLNGRYDLTIRGPARTTEEFLELLRD